MTSVDTTKFSLHLYFVLILHRDDIVPMIDKEMTYDVVLRVLEVDYINLDLFMVSSNSDGRKSGTMKLHSIALHDVGDAGCITRERLLLIMTK